MSVDFTDVAELQTHRGQLAYFAYPQLISRIHERKLRNLQSMPFE